MNNKMNWQVDWSVAINGQVVTDKFRPYLMAIDAHDQDGSASDTCSLTLDNSGAQLRLPSDGDLVTVGLQGIQIFEGTVETVRSIGSRTAGRTIQVKANGFDIRGKAKEPQLMHADDTDLKSFLSKAAQKAGFSLDIDDELGKIFNKYWLQDAESFTHLGQRLAREHQATFKLRGNKAVFAKRGSANAIGILTGTVGSNFTGNVISWNIAPLIGRPAVTAAEATYFDRESGDYKTEAVDINLGRSLPDSINKLRSAAGSKDQAKATADARKREAEREGGEGSVELDIVPGTQPEGLFSLQGADPGVDGLYRIVSVKQHADRNGGAKTSLSLKQPHGGAGTDLR